MDANLGVVTETWHGESEGNTIRERLEEEGGLGCETRHRSNQARNGVSLEGWQCYGGRTSVTCVGGSLSLIHI